ncbi:unnamed protein product [Effrenium voratum]|uniref:Uncharacterized protein n=1 Tax=Effrenium voratum TaxID=2562239 RepID=A0AA36MXG3_9DINO|nr:unnamed protein product [Effrenium voratum]CAJ1440566.1 unnamed protein product [Effrenium voratum]
MEDASPGEVIVWPADEVPKERPAEEPEEQILHIPAPVLALMVDMNVTQPRVLRCTSAGLALRWAGQALRGGVEPDLAFRCSWPTTRIGQFWSHSWHGSLWSKVLTLLLLIHGFPALCCATLAGVVVICLSRPFMERPWEKASLLAVICIACGCLVTTITLLLWRSGRKVFVDQLCIHQKNQELKLEGVLSMGGFLKASDSCLVCWDSSYTERLWCIFELAAFLKSRKTPALAVRPTCLGPALVLSSAGVWGAMLIAKIEEMMIEVDLKADPLSRFMVRLAAVLLVLFTTCSLATSMFRDYHRSVEEMEQRLGQFKLKQAICSCCSKGHINKRTGAAILCDRIVLERCITCWFGSAEAFEESVHLHVLPSLKRQLGPLALPYSWMVGASTPVLWMSLPSLLPFNTNLPVESFPSHYVRTTCFLISWWLAGLPLLLNVAMGLCYLLRAKRSTRCREVLVNLLIPCAAGLLYGLVEGFYIFLYAMANYYYPQNKMWNDASRPEIQVVAAIHAATMVLAILSVYGCRHCREWGFLRP